MTPELKSEDSLLTPYMSDEKNDGTYTLHLDERQTREPRPQPVRL